MFARCQFAGEIQVGKCHFETSREMGTLAFFGIKPQECPKFLGHPFTRTTGLLTPHDGGFLLDNCVSDEFGMS
jgi:hypothetical protein